MLAGAATGAVVVSADMVDRVGYVVDDLADAQQK